MKTRLKVLSAALAMTLLMTGCSTVNNALDIIGEDSSTESGSPSLEYGDNETSAPAADEPANRTWYLNNGKISAEVPDSTIEGGKQEADKTEQPEVDTQNETESKGNIGEVIEIPDPDKEPESTAKPDDGKVSNEAGYFSQEEVAAYEEAATTVVTYNNSTHTIAYQQNDPEEVLYTYDKDDPDGLIFGDRVNESVAPYAKEVVFDQGIKEIGKYALYMYDNPLNVTIGDTVEKIAEPFVECASIETITLKGENNDHIQVIDNTLYVYSEDRGGWMLVAHGNTPGETSFALPDGLNVVYICQNAFYGTDTLKTVDLSACKVEFGDGVFAYAGSIDTMILNAGMNAGALKSYNLGDCPKYIKIGNQSYTRDQFGYSSIDPNI